MAWEGSWTPARTPSHTKQRWEPSGKGRPRNLLWPRGHPQPRAETSWGGPLSLVIRVSTPGRPQLSPASFARGNQVPRGLAGYGCASLGPVDSDFRAVIVVGLGSLVGREA